MKRKHKGLLYALGITLICVGVVFLLFSKKETGNSLVVEYAENNSVAPLGVSIEEYSFVASLDGTKYYPIGCSGAERIKEENRVYYKTKEEAERDQKSPAALCK
jgi:hypothetical protein